MAMGDDRTGQQERADTLAYLQRRLRVVEAMASVQLDHADDARVMKRQLEVILQDIGQGLHEGEAQVAAVIARDEEGGL